eukprot:8200783-Pyramimonas_sp.AAC.1
MHTQLEPNAPHVPNAGARCARRARRTTRVRCAKNPCTQNVLGTPCVPRAPAAASAPRSRHAQKMP